MMWKPLNVEYVSAFNRMFIFAHLSGRRFVNRIKWPSGRMAKWNPSNGIYQIFAHWPHNMLQTDTRREACTHAHNIYADWAIEINDFLFTLEYFLIFC